MEENTDANSTAPITDDSTVEDIAEELAEQDSQEAEPVEQAESIADAVEQVEAQPTRSERREQNYIDKLSEQIRNSGQSRRSNDESGQRNEYQPLKYEDGDFAIDQLEQDRQAYGDYQRALGQREAQSSIAPIRQEVWAQQLEFDNERVQKSWDILDESNDKTFDQDFASEMTQKYLNFIGYRVDNRTGAIEMDRPNIRWIDFVKAEKQNLDRYVARAKETSTKNIVKQASNTGMRPTAKSRSTSHREVDTTDPNWISKLTSKEYEDWGRDLSDKVIAERLGINK